MMTVMLVLLAGTGPGEAPRLSATVETDCPPESEEFGFLFGTGCSLGCAIDWWFTASSTRAPRGEVHYRPGNLDDLDPASAWIEGAEGWGVGEVLRAEFGRLEPKDMEFWYGIYGDDAEEILREPIRNVSFRGMTLQNGYALNEKTWHGSGRVRELALFLNGEPFCVVELADAIDPQTVFWTDLYEDACVSSGDVLDMVIRSVYEGSRWEDTALSGIMFWGAH